MFRLRPVALLVSLFVVGCGSAPAPSPSRRSVPPPAATSAATPVANASPATPPSPTAIPSPSAATAARELVAGTDPLPAGTYTNSAFRPRVTLAVEDGWVAGTVSPGFFDVQQEAGSPDVIAVQFARIDGIVGASGAVSVPPTASAAVEAIHQNQGVVVGEESASKIGGLEGLNLVIENKGAANAPIMRVSAGTLGIDPKRRLWVSLFDSSDGVLAIMVGGSVATWDDALATAEPVLESVLIGPQHAAGESIHIALGDGGPIGIDTIDDLAWVVLTDSGDLVEVDLGTERIVRTTHIGSGGSQVAAIDGGPVYVGKYDGGQAGDGVAVIGADGSVRGIKVGPVGGLALDDERMWVLQKSGDVTLIDPATGETAGSTTVHVDQDAHMDAVAGAGSAWVSGDRTPVHRISGPPKVVADIETGGGIPLAFADGLVWGARPDQLWAIDPVSNTVTPADRPDERRRDPGARCRCRRGGGVDRGPAAGSCRDCHRGRPHHRGGHLRDEGVIARRRPDRAGPGVGHRLRG